MRAGWEGQKERSMDNRIWNLRREVQIDMVMDDEEQSKMRIAAGGERCCPSVRRGAKIGIPKEEGRMPTGLGKNGPGRCARGMSSWMDRISQPPGCFWSSTSRRNPIRARIPISIPRPRHHTTPESKRRDSKEEAREDTHCPPD